LALCLSAIVASVLSIFSILELRAHRDGPAAILLVAGSIVVIVCLALLVVSALLYGKARQGQKTLRN
jgi:hypothetical protein